MSFVSTQIEMDSRESQFPRVPQNGPTIASLQANRYHLNNKDHVSKPSIKNSITCSMLSPGPQELYTGYFLHVFNTPVILVQLR